MKKAYERPELNYISLTSEEQVTSQDVVEDGDTVVGSLGAVPNPF